MYRFIGLSVFLLLAPAAACKTEEAPPGGPPSGLSGPNMSGARPRRMANCPSAVRGAITTTTPTPDGIDVVVTAPDPAAERKIVGLAEFHAQFPRPLSPFPHNGLGGGRGHIGFCPIVRGTASITATAVPGGVRVHLSETSPERVRALQRIVQERTQNLRAFAQS
jgi:hypothetical protein